MQPHPGLDGPVLHIIPPDSTCAFLAAHPLMALHACHICLSSHPPPCLCLSGPKGGVRIEVTFNLDAQNVLSVTAIDLDTQRQMQWLSQGAMVAHKVSEDVRTV